MPRKIQRTLSGFTRRLTDEYDDAKAYLFGSYARGTWLDDSDFDIIVVSKGFEGQPFVKRVAAIRRLAPEERPFEIIAYTPAEFREAMTRSVAIQDGRNYWIRIV